MPAELVYRELELGEMCHLPTGRGGKKRRCRKGGVGKGVEKAVWGRGWKRRRGVDNKCPHRSPHRRHIRSTRQHRGPDAHRTTTSVLVMASEEEALLGARKFPRIWTGPPLESMEGGFTLSTHMFR